MEMRLPNWVRAIILISALMQLSFGMALLLDPSRIAELWPWKLPPAHGASARRKHARFGPDVAPCDRHRSICGGGDFIGDDADLPCAISFSPVQFIVCFSFSPAQFITTGSPELDLSRSTISAAGS